MLRRRTLSGTEEHLNAATNARKDKEYSAIGVSRAFVVLDVVLNRVGRSSSKEPTGLSFNDERRIACYGIPNILCLQPKFGCVKEDPAPRAFDSGRIDDNNFVFRRKPVWANAHPFGYELACLVEREHESANVELTGAARLYRAASSDRRERG